MLSRLLCAALSMLAGCVTAQAADIRRVVTGLDANNKAIVQFDERLPLAPGPYGIAGLNLWITDSSPAPLVFDGDP